MFSFKRQTGNQAENPVLIYLQENDLQLIEQNYLTKCGEINIIMLDKSEQTLVFVEVRYRQNDQFISATDTVDRSTNKVN
jgi:putative endonuclease